MNEPVTVELHNLIARQNALHVKKGELTETLLYLEKEYKHQLSKATRIAGTKELLKQKIENFQARCQSSQLRCETNLKGAAILKYRMEGWKEVLQELDYIRNVQNKNSQEMVLSRNVIHGKIDESISKLENLDGFQTYQGMKSQVMGLQELHEETCAKIKDIMAKHMSNCLSNVKAVDWQSFLINILMLRKKKLILVVTHRYHTSI
uniref:Coiled-coil domain containing 125 n=1 Tax=Rhabditophanes sp. KR3021 TaxID=114890 RepID=A0AC35UEA5_9BILA